MNHKKWTIYSTISCSNSNVKNIYYKDYCTVTIAKSMCSILNTVNGTPTHEIKYRLFDYVTEVNICINKKLPKWAKLTVISIMACHFVFLGNCHYNYILQAFIVECILYVL